MLNALLRLLLLSALLFLTDSYLVAQQEHSSWYDSLEQLVDVEDYEAGQLEEIYEALCELESNPINLNTATPDDLQQLIFLNQQQIHDLYQYIHRYRPVLTLGELLMVPTIERIHFSLLLPFVYAGQPEQPQDTTTIAHLLSKGSHELTANLRLPLYERKGNRNGYLGYKYKHWLRYNFNSHDRLRFGVVASQDSGEPFFSAPATKGYDYYSFYLQYRGNKTLRNIVAGRYRMTIGKGLVLNNDLSFGKSAMLTSLGRTTDRLRPHSSRSESNYFQGAAAEIAIGNRITATAFASYRAIDATLNDDGSISTILTSGYHRTPSEVERRHNAHTTTLGAALRLNSSNAHIGAVAIHTAFDRTLNPSIKYLYRRHSPAGKSFTNAGINYSWRRSLLSLSGETAVSANGALATLNTMNLHLDNGMALFLVQRFYSYKYTALHANSLSNGSSVQNESGILVGASWHPSYGLSLNAYSDIAYFAWPKYQSSQSSRLFDNMLSATYSNKKWSFSARYRMKMSEKDNEKKTGLQWFTTHSARLTATRKFGLFSTKSRFYLSASTAQKTSLGYMLGQSIGYNDNKISAEAAIGIFHTDDYDSRIYSTERSMLYSMSSLVCYGYGIRYSLFARARISDRLMLLAKVATTNYFDRSTIGSGLQEIDASSATDVDLQLKWRF